MVRVETFATTADVGIRIQGSSFSELYSAALSGVLLLYFNELPEQTLRSTLSERYPFSFQGDSCENVLVNLLGEIIFLLQDRALVTVALDIHEAQKTKINADFLTLPLEREPLLEIKSVTYHNLSLTDQQGIKSAAIIFDI